ncbi:MAG: glycine cleavage system protein H [Anaerolineae bacterium]|nr:glycine cleavage system protein H [Anaerolineae bacterium]
MTPQLLEARVDKFIFRVMPGYLYSEAGVWAATDETQQIVRLGLSDYRQQSSGDVAFFNAPATGRRVSQGDELASIETVKVDLEVPSPLTGEIVAANEALEDTPELINQDPYGRGWLVELRPDQWPPTGLLDAAQYLTVMTAQAEAEAAA